MNEDLRARSLNRGELVIPELPLLARLNQRGFRLVMLADAAAVMGALTLTLIVRFGLGWPDALPWPAQWRIVDYLVALLLAAVLHVAIYYFGGLYERELRLGSRPQLPRIAAMTLTAVLLIALIELFSEAYILPRAHLPFALVLVSLAIAGNRRLARMMRTNREGRPRVLLVGVPDEVNLARSHLPADHSAAVVVGTTTTPVDLLDRVEATGATEVLLLSWRMLDDIYPEPLTTLERRGVGVLQRVTARDTLLGLEGVREIAGMPFVALRTHALPRSRARFKRTVELAGLVLMAPLALPLLLAVAAYVRLVAGGPVLFRQDRVGEDGETFRMLKFRTMYPNAEEGVGAVLAKHGDPRVIPACQWLRSTRLDELPQLWNVLRGEMSVVGPRPERPELTAQYEELIPGYARRHEIPPGITGLAQIQGRYHTDPEYKLGHDLQYLVNWSPVLDLQILVRTIWVVLARKV